MALHTELSLNIAAYGSAVKENCNFIAKFESKVLDTLEQESSGRVKLAAGAADVDFNFQGVTNGQLIVLKSDAAFGVKFNGIGNPLLSLAPQENTQTLIATPAFLAMLADGITSIHLTNASLVDAIEVDISIAGV